MIKPNSEIKSHLIKKYPNRRLYDSDLSTYITLEDLKRYVVEEIPFKVIDAKTSEDVTKSALVQIIFECEATQNSFFTEEILKQMIKFYDHPLQKKFKEYLKTSFAFFNGQF